MLSSQTPAQKSEGDIKSSTSGNYSHSIDTNINSTNSSNSPPPTAASATTATSTSPIAPPTPTTSVARDKFFSRCETMYGPHDIFQTDQVIKSCLVYYYYYY